MGTDFQIEKLSLFIHRTVLFDCFWIQSKLKSYLIRNLLKIRLFVYVCTCMRKFSEENFYYCSGFLTGGLTMLNWKVHKWKSVGVQKLFHLTKMKVHLLHTTTVHYIVPHPWVEDKVMLIRISSEVLLICLYKIFGFLIDVAKINSLELFI